MPLIKLKLSRSQATFEIVKRLKGIEGLELDESYGLALIDPIASLYVVRASFVDRIEERRRLSPEIVDDDYPETLISGTSPLPL